MFTELLGIIDNESTEFPTSDDSDDMSFVISKPRSKSQLFVNEEEESVVSTDGSLNKSSEPSSSTTEPSVKRPKIVKNEDDSIPLPNPFPLPKHYPHDIQCALNNVHQR